MLYIINEIRNTFSNETCKTFVSYRVRVAICITPALTVYIVLCCRDFKTETGNGVMSNFKVNHNPSPQKTKQTLFLLVN